MLACSVLLLTACGPVGDGDDSGTSGSGGAVRDGGMMTVALADDPDMLDPTLAQTLVGRMVFMSMCEKLYDHRPEAERRATVGGEPADHLAGRAQRRDQAPPGGQVQRRHDAGRRGGQEVPDRHRTLEGSHEGSQRTSELLAVTGVDVVGSWRGRATGLRPQRPRIRKRVSR